MSDTINNEKLTDEKPNQQNVLIYDILKKKSLKFCTRCVYDEETPGISFDDEGVCNYCRQHEKLLVEYPAGDEGRKILHKIYDEIKEAGKNKKYDCVIGISGGADSSYLLYEIKKYGLRPLAVHFDNTWN